MDRRIAYASVILLPAALLAALLGCENPVLDTVKNLVEIYNTPPAIELKDPNGGEIYAPGESCEIRWEHPTGEGTVTIELLRGDTAVQTVASGISTGAGIYTWVIPAGQGAANDYEIQVTHDDSGVHDESDAPFSIGALVLTAPDGGEGYKPGQSCTIQWQSGVGGNVKIDLHKGGAYSAPIVGTTDNDGSYDWGIPVGQTEGGDYSIRITSVENATIFDDSDAPFAVGTVTVAYPDGGEVLAADTEYAITWVSGMGGMVKIDLYKAGSQHSTIAASTQNDGSHDWIVPAGLTPATDYKIRISTLTDPAVADDSDASFTVDRMVISSPNGGEIYYPGETATATWTSISGGNVKIDLYQGATLDRNLLPSIANDGTENWTVPSVSGNDYSLRITSLSHPDVADESDSAFAVGTITVTDPNGGETFEAGESTTVTWTSVVGGNVRIDLMENTTVKLQISTGTGNDGSHPWTIPTNVAPGTQYRIRVTSTANGGVTDSSNGNFTIRGWESLGFASPGAAGVGEQSMDVGTDNSVVVVYRQDTESRVKKRSAAGTWSDLGNPVSGNSTAAILALDPTDDKPVVVLRDGSLRVLKWSSGQTWTDLGAIGTDTSYAYAAVAVGADGKPVVIYDDADSTPDDLRARVKKYVSGTGAGATWTDLGYVSPERAIYVAVETDPSDGKPVVAFEDEYNTGKVHVLKYSSGTGGSAVWTDLGFVGGYVDKLALELDPTDNKPVVLFTYYSNKDLYVYKWSSAQSWTSLGMPSDNAYYPSLKVDGSGKPIISYREDGAILVRKWTSGTAWSSLGTPTSSGSGSCLELQTDGTPLILLRDSQYGDRAHLKRRVD